MEPETILQALINVWAELPEKLGPEWQEFYHEVGSRFEQMQTAQETKERAGLAIELMKLWGRYTGIRKYLHEAIEAAALQRGDSRYKGGVQPSSDAANWTELVTGLVWASSPPPETRYADITTPRRITAGQRGVVTVALTRAPVPDSEQPKPLKVAVEQFIEVSLHGSGKDFQIIGEPVKRVRLERNKDSEHAVFHFRGTKPGTVNLWINFRQSGITVGTVRLRLDVLKETPPSDDVQVVQSGLQMGGSYYPPPDLEIRVMTERSGAGIEINYELHSPNGAADYHHYFISGPTINFADRYKEDLMEKIEALSRGEESSGGRRLTREESEEKIESLGRELYERLFSQGMRSAYLRFRDKVKTILITSDEPWIPWEMLKPYDDSDIDHPIDDDFLCARFQLTRWLASQSGPPGSIYFSKLACIEAATPPNEPPLAYAAAEHEHIARAFQPAQDVTPKLATRQAVRSLLDGGGIGLWHFAAHGNYIAGNPNESLIVLSDGKRLRAEDLTGKRQTNIARDRPLMFLNACRVGQQGWSLTGLAGWATTLVGNCRCGAFVGPLWGVNDHLAFEFAKIFYAALHQEKTIGEAAQEARSHTRKIDAAKLTWLAYNIYAHPNARLYPNQSPPTPGRKRP